MVDRQIMDYFLYTSTPTPSPLTYVHSRVDEVKAVEIFTKALLLYIFLRDLIFIVLPWIGTRIVAWVEGSFAKPQSVLVSAAESIAEDIAEEVQELAESLADTTGNFISSAAKVVASEAGDFIASSAKAISDEASELVAAGAKSLAEDAVEFIASNALSS